MGTCSILYRSSLANCQLFSKEKKLIAVFTEGGIQIKQEGGGDRDGSSLCPQRACPIDFLSSASLTLSISMTHFSLCVDQGYGVAEARITRWTF